jgi:phenylalanyl-tRNA synthetase alpha chain
MENDLDKLIESLSPIEQKILPFIEKTEIEDIIENSKLDRVSVLRGLEFLSSKKIISLKIEKEKIIEIGTNGVYYLKKGLPERQLALLLEKGNLKMQEAEKVSKLSKNEFKAALGVLKKKALIEIKNGTLILTGNKEEIAKKSLEEQFLEKLPKSFEELEPEEKFAFDLLKERKEIIEIEEKQIVNYELTNLGKELLKKDFSYTKDLIEELTSDILKNNSWKGKKFRRYNVVSQVPKIYGGKKHFVNQSIDYGRKIWSEMGFKEMEGDLIQSSFWNFDALFTAQDHPVREMQDTFFLSKSIELEDKKIVKKIKDAHEGKITGSKGWQYEWDEKVSEQAVLRTHTTCLSAKKLFELGKLSVEKRNGKFFAIGKNFRNETVDWSHGFEFNQTEGIVVDKNVNFRHLLGYLQEFFKKMGFEKVRFRPAYFPYTEPSVEIDVYHNEKKCWLELGGAGIFRPEVTISLLGEEIPVLAWGPGFDRILMDYYEIKDLREFYKNNIDTLRKMRFWVK